MSLRDDLEGLYDYISEGWSGRNDKGEWIIHGGIDRTTGMFHGCLLSCMCDVISASRNANRPVDSPGRQRLWNMVGALGFVTYEEMYDWNDTPNRDWDSVLDLVKTAVGEAQ